MTDMDLPDEVREAIEQKRVAQCKADHRQNVWRVELIARTEDGGTKGHIASFPTAAIGEFRELCARYGVDCVETVKE